MRLTSDRLHLAAGERMGGLAVVSASRVAIAARGGLGHLRHAFEDAGFRDVVLSDGAPPPSGAENETVPAVSFPEWLLGLEMTAREGGSYTRDLIEDVRIVRAWPRAVSVAVSFATPLHPYAVEMAPPSRVGGLLRVFRVAYPLGGTA